MRIQLAILIFSIKKHFIQLLAVVGSFFFPINGILISIAFAVCVDTITGIWKAHKLSIPITSRGLSAIVSKLFLYEVAIILTFCIDKFILNDIILQFFSVPLMMTKILSLVLFSIEAMSISENYKAVKGIDLWTSLRRLFARAKEIKHDIDEVRNGQNHSSEA